MSVQFLNYEGEPVTAMDLVTQITASASLKKTDGAYGSADAFQSMTATIPTGLSADTIRGLANDLYAECAAAVEARIADLLTVKTVTKSELDEFFGTREERAAGRQTQKTEQPPVPSQSTDAPQTDGGRVLKFAPKAGERQPGDRWSATVTHYKLTADKLELWKDGSKYPEASLYPNSPAWPEKWIDHMTKDGSKQAFAKPVAVVQVVSDKKNDKGFFYVNVQTLEVEKAAAA